MLFSRRERQRLGCVKLLFVANCVFSASGLDHHLLKDQVLRVEHRRLGAFLPEVQRLLPTHITPLERDTPQKIVSRIVKVPCGERSCSRPQPIWWIEEHVQVVQELMKLRKSGQLPGEKDKKNKRFIIFSTFQQFKLPPSARVSKKDSGGWNIVGGLKLGEAKLLDALLVFDQEVAYAYKKYSSGLHLHWMRAWPHPLNASTLHAPSMKVTFSDPGRRRLQGLWSSLTSRHEAQGNDRGDDSSACATGRGPRFGTINVRIGQNGWHRLQ